MQYVFPDHCLAGTEGQRILAEKFADETLTKQEFSVFNGGKNKSGKNLKEIIKENEITELTLFGLALDICVRATAIDALHLKKALNKIYILKDYSRILIEDPTPELKKKV